MNNFKVKAFTFDQHSVVRVAIVDGNLWFISRDIHKILRAPFFGNIPLKHQMWFSSTAVPHVKDDPQDKLLAISESVLYFELNASSDGVFKALKEWIISTVIPSIKKLGPFSNVPLSPGETLLAQAQALVYLEKQSSLLAERITSLESDLNEKINSLEVKRLQAEVEPLDESSLSDRKVTEINVRGKISRIIRAMAQRGDGEYSNLWRTAYNELKYREHYDVYSRVAHAKKKNKNIIPIAQVEADGKLNELFDIASNLYRKGVKSKEELEELFK